jgi:hypothetical protein
MIRYDKIAHAKHKEFPQNYDPDYHLTSRYIFYTNDYNTLLISPVNYNFSNNVINRISIFRTDKTDSK